VDRRQLTPPTVLKTFKPVVTCASHHFTSLGKRFLTKIELHSNVGGWQARRSRGTNAKGTQAILPDVTRQLARPPMDLTFHLTQGLTGHGCSWHYVHRMKRAPDARYLYCQDPSDTAEHTVFYCVHWREHRLVVNRMLGDREVRPLTSRTFSVVSGTLRHSTKIRSRAWESERPRRIWDRSSTRWWYPFSDGWSRMWESVRLAG